MSFNAFDHVNSDAVARIHDIINNKKFVSYGIVDSVVDDDYVYVLDAVSCVKEVERVFCKYLRTACSQVSVDFAPKKGDLVLVLGLQSGDDRIYTATEPVDIYPKQGYNKDRCVALPVGLHLPGSDVTISVKDGEVDLNVTKLSVTSESSSFDTGDTVINNGTMGAARVNDQVMSVFATDDPTFMGWVTAVSTTLNSLVGGSVPVVPVSLTGKIASGSGTVKIGD